MMRSKSTSDSNLGSGGPLSAISTGGSSGAEHSSRCSLALPEDVPIPRRARPGQRRTHAVDHTGSRGTHSDQLHVPLSPASSSDVSDLDDSVFTSVTDAQIEEYRDVFRIFDVNQDGMITSAELIKILRSCGLEPTDSQVKVLIDNIDTNGNGVIEFSEFVNLMVKHGNPKEDDLKDAFKVFDQDNNGYIDAPELQSILDNMGENLTMEQVEDMIREADLNGDGQIDYEEFIKMMTCLGGGSEIS